jgi:UDP-N-acetyl-D-glucosamine dehydrogenase
MVNEKVNVSIIGQGYVGLPLSLAAANAGWVVTGVEIDESRFRILESGASPIESLDENEIQRLSALGKYKVENNFESLKSASIVVVCVPTPLNVSGIPDLTPLRGAVEEIDRCCGPDTLIINESTSHPETLRNLFSRRLESNPTQQRFDYAVAPERIDPGNTLYSIGNTPRIVGALSERALNRVFEFYNSFTAEVIKVSSPEVAELAKLLENSFRLVNISLVNELSILSAKIGIDSREVIKAAATKPFGFMPFFPSIGIGGHCIPIDPVYLSEYSKTKGVKQTLIERAKELDTEMSDLVVGQIKSKFPEVSSITIVGIGYKSGSKDTRLSPSIRLMRFLRNQGYKVDWIDSVVQELLGEKSASELTSDVAILTSTDSSFDAERYLSLGGKILDFTGTLMSQEGVFRF